MHRYTTSTEEYKGYTIVCGRYSFDGVRWHKECFLYKDGNQIGCGNGVHGTKKEIKEEIDAGAWDLLLKLKEKNNGK